jgi:hypothetical protein
MKPFSLRLFVPCLALAWLTSTMPLLSETRAFTDTSGRTIRGELVTVLGQFVTIKREDGQNFTVKASNFSEADIDYFKAHGLTADTKSATGAPITAASNAPLRLDVRIYPKKTERRHGADYYVSQRVTYKIEVRNSERQRDLEKAHATLISVAKMLGSTDESQIIGIEEFDVSVKPLATFTQETKEPAKATYYGTTTFYGTRFSSYVLVLKDSAGKVINVTSGSESLEKRAEELLKLKLWDQFDKTFRKTKEGSPPID